jgi:hypothetical protein
MHGNGLSEVLGQEQDLRSLRRGRQVSRRPALASLPPVGAAGLEHRQVEGARQRPFARGAREPQAPLRAGARADPREGWAEDAQRLADSGDSALVWPEFSNEVDDDWVW